uniref:Uncharacterized protein n=1 Tax=Oryza barthii TaxID=65489 RepID=A0A0D3G4V9_9ORYZ
MTAPIPDLLLLPRLHCNLFVGLFFLYINMPNTGTSAIGGSIGNGSGIAGRDSTENDNTNGGNTIALSSTGAFSKLNIPIYDHIFNTALIYNSAACAGRLRAAACLPRPPHRCPVRPREIKLNLRYMIITCGYLATCGAVPCTAAPEPNWYYKRATRRAVQRRRQGEPRRVRACNTGTRTKARKRGSLPFLWMDWTEESWAYGQDFNSEDVLGIGNMSLRPRY